ncbi:trehalose operon repressor [Clostridium septicum]|uniref:Trehalose operon repressor n=1 Tax=Clostridium septicum TaxID=1504 RepID=A0A9N7JKJ8_CLOSE|nr:trehalose operon repressor [Clostridium septicum]AYE34259.1 trehalose operon repressor [Clostridium septicum]MDU1313291.1 trehalose operon repressor [Clostridium septicum]QAS59666.1 trehalose operon repressor [Clostridium septicum]UEC21103.1 trehalose operon repressor [Clostridium septicum]USS00848.1 trehalose operon repressor [Clostridium septicum]
MDKKYLNIYNTIVNQIENNEYQANDKLPSEKDIMNNYNVSRDTVRKALNMLEQNGYIQKTKGKGSFVLDIGKFNFPVSGVVSFKELAEKLGMNVDTDVKDLECIIPKKNIARGLELNEYDKVWRVVRVRSIDNEKVILDKDYIVEKFVENLTHDVCKESLYKYIEGELGLKIAYAKKEITVQNATEEDKKHLDMKGFEMIVVVKSYIYLDDTSLFQYTESRHRPDKFVFVDFARRC